MGGLGRGGAGGFPKGVRRFDERAVNEGSLAVCGGASVLGHWRLGARGVGVVCVVFRDVRVSGKRPKAGPRGARGLAP